MGEDGKPAKPGLIPTLDESIENKTILLGSPEQVAEGIQFYRDLLGVEHLTIFPHLIGDPYAGTSAPDRFINVSAFKVPCTLDPTGDGSAGSCIPGT